MKIAEGPAVFGLVRGQKVVGIIERLYNVMFAAIIAAYVLLFWLGFKIIKFIVVTSILLVVFIVSLLVSLLVKVVRVKRVKRG